MTPIAGDKDNCESCAWRMQEKLLHVGWTVCYLAGAKHHEPLKPSEEHDRCSVAFCTFSGFMENPSVGKKLKTLQSKQNAPENGFLERGIDKSEGPHRNLSKQLVKVLSRTILQLSRQTQMEMTCDMLEKNWENTRGCYQVALPKAPGCDCSQ